MEHPPPRIRPMALADCDRVSGIRVRGWQHAYRGLMPQAYLDGLSAAADAGRRRARFGQGDGPAGDLVAERGGEVVGWAAYGPYRDGAARTGDAELYALYVDPARLGEGIGRALLAAADARCAWSPRMRLWVVGDNVRARRFYESAGFRADGAEEAFEVDGVPVTEVRYARDTGR
ncbi:GNAT family N-acetyltransferase [Streptomyces sp. TG1A-8]|uniref:GNAT family N-acetyltransferase n=1 Tax=Streptomyces sp. TG1A-8 TaxID=3051385 RepID=UPI00265B7697|nr:GNAT family N-acetyltransferase [Streptomyces sp. TG1A-8]MDO0924918.1 GNAT family N-acetyltransferase [Streptomyces sp. TG1A-8]